MEQEPSSRASVFERWRRPEASAAAPVVPEPQTAPRATRESSGIFERMTRRPEAASRSTDAQLKVSRALEVFNSGDEVQTIAAISRSLGTPTVTALPAPKSTIVTITVAWELSWYVYEIDLSDESGGARLADRGNDQSELAGREQRDNVRTDDRGRLHLSGLAA